MKENSLEELMKC